MNSQEIITYKIQGLTNSEIAKTIGCDDSEVAPLVDSAIEKLKENNKGSLPPAILLELARVDKLVAIMFDDLLNVTDETCEFTGKKTRDAFQHRRAITDTVRKLIESKAKLLQLSLVYSEVKSEENKETTASDYKSLDRSDKLKLFRDLLES